MKLTKLVVASHNDGKVAEIKALLAPLHIEVQSARELRLGDVEETGKTFEENAKIKANALSLMCGLPCLADDSGLCIDALDGRPGVYSARYAPDRDFKQGMEMLLKEISESGKESRKAHFSCCMALACPNEKVKLKAGLTAKLPKNRAATKDSATIRFSSPKVISKPLPNSATKSKTRFPTAAVRWKNSSGK